MSTATHQEIGQAVEVLRRAGFSFSSPIQVRWLTVREVADRLSVHPRTVRRLLDAGEFGRALRWGAEVRVSERAFSVWVAQHQAGPEVAGRGARGCPGTGRGVPHEAPAASIDAFIHV